MALRRRGRRVLIYIPNDHYIPSIHLAPLAACSSVTQCDTDTLECDTDVLLLLV